MQRAMILWHARKLTTIRLELLQSIDPRIVAVRAPTNLQQAVIAAKRDFLHVAGITARSDDAMSRLSLKCGWRRREARIQIALLRGEFTERPNCNLEALCHGSLQRT